MATAMRLDPMWHEPGCVCTQLVLWLSLADSLVRYFNGHVLLVN